MLAALDPTEPLWCERTQDMSGYVLPDSISPPLDERLDFTISTAQTENDFYVQNSDNPSPEEFFWGDNTTDVLADDSNMFEQSNYSELHNKMKEWLPSEISSSEIDEFAQTSMLDDNNGDLLPRIDCENSLIFVETPKVDKRPSAISAKKSRLQSIFDCEEPYIADPEIPSSCADDKLTFDIKDEMEVAEEVVVTTEEVEEFKPKFLLDSVLYDLAAPEFSSVEPKEEIVTTSEDLSSPLSISAVLESTYNMDMDFFDEEDFLIKPEPSPLPEPPPKPLLSLDIEAALVSASQLLSGALPDTPEVLRPVLKPEDEFDLVNFLLDKGDFNNNSNPMIPATATTTSTSRPIQTPRAPQERRQGKSHLSLTELKHCVTYGRGKPSPARVQELREPSPEPCTSFTPTGRPARRSATKFKKLLEEGLLDSTVDSHSVSSDDEDSVPAKRRRMRSVSSSSSRKRLNSDSDISSVCEDQKYRQRRDRNNLSSKRSRQKRKNLQEQKRQELTELEEKKKRLRKRSEALAAALTRLHTAWRECVVKAEHDGEA